MNRLIQTILLFVAVALSSTSATGVGGNCDAGLEGKFACFNSDFLVCANGKWIRQNTCQGKCSEDPATSIYCAVTLDGGAMRYNPRTAINSFETATSPSSGAVNSPVPKPPYRAPQRAAAPPPPPSRASPPRAQLGSQRYSSRANMAPQFPPARASPPSQPQYPPRRAQAPPPPAPETEFDLQYDDRTRGNYYDYDRDADMEKYFEKNYGY